MTICVDGLVLAGGQSQRMGRDKAELLHPSGVTWAEYARHTLQQSGAQTIWISRPFGYQPRTFYDVVDNTPHPGPLGGIAQALTVSSADFLAVLATDLPFASPRLFAHLFSHLGEADGIFPYWRQDRQPLAGYWSVHLLPALQQFLSHGGHKVQEFLASQRILWVLVPEPTWIVNINTPEDWAHWQSTSLPEGSVP
ncbi:MAG: molybdenum cofactor guanylyltransferase [Sulfobacillus thermosulfidooxidans]|uniref:molybdenum cofactor guanylyltransferase n=1 Tax=Sulfobacillus TaxID=28033 RepID=UPI000CD21E03|nr:molybdenum cofactor guanylyltransferase [Sulfobacillus sp. hq2]POB11136.1 hypothetical protein CO251_06230 [Sulfobacillus sp. hq2]PSR37338.1 MAG: molybdenum cofactor guanylyltransferase [Sulfobacillus thermosulfidooxidans]